MQPVHVFPGTLFVIAAWPTSFSFSSISPTWDGGVFAAGNWVLKGSLARLSAMVATAS